MINFKTFQEKIIQELVTVVSGLLDKSNKNSICVFQAPTGSGKTLMAGQFIKDLITDNPFVDLSFIWVSIGKGELHIQSKEKLEKYFGGALTCSLVEHEFGGYRSEIDKNEVVFVNWEKLRNKDRKTNSWSNSLMKKGEKVSFPEVLENTRRTRKLVMIIDESHYGTTTERAIELKEIIDADVIVDISATPSYIPNGQELAQKKAGYIFVDPNEVIEAGLIKKEVLINESLELLADTEELTSLQAVIKAAVGKRQSLKNSYKNEGSIVNPLVLVQIPNSDEGNLKLDAVKNILKEYGIEEKNNKLAIWVSDYKSTILELEDITKNDNQLEFLIFKQAIDTGWDCPRAQILVKLREVKSETFEIQTVGRILRMPEQHHYVHHEDLNKAYIFTNIESIIVKREEYNPNIIKDLKSVLNNDYDTNLNISSFYKSRADFGSLTRDFYTTLEEVANQHLHLKSTDMDYLNNIANLTQKGFDFSFTIDPQKLEVDILIESGRIDEGFSVNQDENKADFKLDDHDLHALFEHTIRKNLGAFAPKRSISPARMAVYRYFRIYFGSQNWEDEFKNIQVVFLKNKDQFIPIFVDAIEAHKSVHARIVNEKSVENLEAHYNLPEVLYHNRYTEEIVPFSKYVYSPCYLDIDRRNTERRFEDHVDQSDKVLWWFKNGESKKEYLGIKYEFEGTIHTFYPDYIVKTVDGNIGIIEIKDQKDQEGLTKTKAKAESLYQYLKNENSRPELSTIFGGIVVFHNERFIMNTKSSYEWNKTLNNDWSDWNNLEEI